MRGTKRICLENILKACLSICLSFSCGLLTAQEDRDSTKQTVEPVFRIPKLNRPQQTPPVKTQGTDTGQTQVQPINNVAAAPQKQNFAAPPVARVAAREIGPVPEKKPVDLVPVEKLEPAVEFKHPLDRAVEIAESGLDSMQRNIADYTAILVKRERVGDVLSEPIYIKIKIRNPRRINNRDVPFSIYMKFLKPRACAGREVVWVQGQNRGNLIAHETTPLLKFKNFHLDPDGFLAMKGNKYPVYDAGLENLTLQLIEKAVRDRAAGQCEVKYLEGAKINKRPCTVIEVKHPQRKAPYEFHIAKVYIDDEYLIPIRFVSYDWPVGNSKPKIIEEYTYVNVALNVGLTDYDFNISNPAYAFAK